MNRGVVHKKARVIVGRCERNADICHGRGCQSAQSDKAGCVEHSGYELGLRAWRAGEHGGDVFE
jgi:hypothetical protein